jgi:hypothetical protein
VCWESELTGLLVDEAARVASEHIHALDQTRCRVGEAWRRVGQDPDAAKVRFLRGYRKSRSILTGLRPAARLPRPAGAGGDVGHLAVVSAPPQGATERL